MSQENGSYRREFTLVSVPERVSQIKIDLKNQELEIPCKPGTIHVDAWPWRRPNETESQWIP